MFILKDSWFEKNNLNVVDYQTRVITECINSLNTQELPVVMGATPSAGKTVMSIYIANHYIKKGLKVLVLTHGTTVIKNNYSASVMSLKNDFTYQIFNAGDTMQDVDMLITLPQSIKKQDLSRFDMVIVDEAHERYFAKELQDIIIKVKPSKQLLLTGTPSPFIKSEINYPIHIVSMQEAYQQGRISNMTVHLCSSTYDIRDNDFNTTSDLSTRGDGKLNKKDTEATLDNLLGELKNKLTNVFQGKVGATIHNIFNWSLAIKEMGKTMIAANSIEQAKHIQEYFNNQGINTLISTHEDDVDSTQIDLFKNDEQYKILVVVRRGILGFDMPTMVNVIDMTASRNLDRIYQLMSRVARKRDDVKMKHFIKMAVPNTEATYELVMTAVLCLMSAEYISKFDGRNFGQFEIPVVPERRERTDDGDDRDPQPRRRAAIRPINILGMPTVDFFEKVFHKDGKVLNTHSLARISDVMYELGIFGDRVPIGYWDVYENTKNEALKYKTRSEFRKSTNGCYEAARRNGWLDDICSHMDEPLKSWDYESLKNEASKYMTRSEFQKGGKGAYEAARRNGWLDDICSHMDELLKSWDYESVKKEALKYNTRTEFSKGSMSAYVIANRNGWLDDICSHMDELKKSWDFESVEKEASKYNTRTEFSKGSPKAYAKASKMGWLDDVCKHMLPGKHKNGYWHIYENTKNEASKYMTRSEFQKGTKSAYSVAYKNGWLDEFFPKK